MCKILYCKNTNKAKDLCSKHYDLMWKRNHPEYGKKYSKKRRSNPEYILYQKNYMAKYGRRRWREDSQYRERIKHESRALDAALKLCVLEHYSKGELKCICCSEKIYEFLTIEHINGGGNKHRKEVGCGSRFFRWLIDNNFPIGYEVMCMNCNWAKGKYRECPHKW